MTKIVFVNPRFEVSYWGLEHALPLLHKRANLPTACLPLLAALTPACHAVEILDENVEPLDFERLAEADIVALTGMSVQRGRMREILHELKSRGVFTVVGGPWVTVREDYFGDLADVIFIGEAEETWPQFLKEWQAGQHQLRYEQAEKTDMTTRAGSAIRSAEDAALLVWQRSVFARLPISMRVLRHHRHVWPPAAAKDEHADSARAGIARRAGNGNRIHRGRQPDRQ